MDDIVINRVYHYLIVPDNPCFHSEDCDCLPELTTLHVCHDVACPKKEILEFEKDGVKITWEEFDCFIGRNIYSRGLEYYFRHYLDPFFNINKNLSSENPMALEAGKYKIQSYSDGIEIEVRHITDNQVDLDNAFQL